MEESLQRRLAVLYLSAYAGYGVLLPFLPLVLRSRGLPDSEVAVAISAMGLSALLGPIIFGYLADRGYSFSRLFFVMVVASAGIAPFFVFFSDAWGLSAVVFLEFLFYLPALSLCDQYTLSLLATDGSPAHRFQAARRWGSIGFMLPSLILASIAQFFEISPTLLVLMCSFALILAAAVAFRLPDSTRQFTRSRIPTLDALRIAWKRPLRDFFCASLLVGMSASIFYTFFPRYLQELGCSTVTIGLVVNFGVFCETLLMPYTMTLINRYGAERVICIGMSSIAIRLILHIAFPNLAVATLVQIFHAPMVIGLFVAVPIYLQTRASESIRYSLQSLYAATMMGGARLLGPNIAGVVLILINSQGLISIRLIFLVGAILGSVGGYWMFKRVATSPLPGQQR